MKKNNIFYINLFLPVVLGSFVGILINGNLNLNITNMPPFSASGIVFPIAWTIIYILMGLSYAFFKEKDSDDAISLLYYLQLGVNLVWPIIFFILQLRFISIIWIIILDVLVILLFIQYFNKKHKLSAYLLIPYILWIIYATYLTIGIYILN